MLAYRKNRQLAFHRWRKSAFWLLITKCATAAIAHVGGASPWRRRFSARARRSARVRSTSSLRIAL
jgi:hypothetical protein